MLEQAIALAKAGDKQTARDILHEITAQEPENEHAWGWLAACAADDASRLINRLTASTLPPTPSHPRKEKPHPFGWGSVLTLA